MTEKFKWLLSIQTGPDGKPLTQERWGKLLGIGRVRLCHLTVEQQQTTH